MNILNEEHKESKASFDSSLIFPTGVVVNDISSVSMKNVVLDDDGLTFDLNLFNVDLREFTKLKIILLDQRALDILQGEDFPEKLTKASRDILFSTENQKNVFGTKEKMTNIRLKYERLNSPVKILVNLVASSRFGIVNLFSFNKNDVLYKKSDFKILPLTNFNFERLGGRTSGVVEALKDETHTSDLYYSYSDNEEFSGFYAIDAEKFVNQYAKFPNLININNPQMFSEFLIKTECYLLRYDIGDGGYKFDRILGPTRATAVSGLRARSAGGKIFYNFLLGGVLAAPKYQAKLVFTFNDISLNMLRSRIDVLSRAIKNNDTESIKFLVNEIYGEKLPDEYREGIDQINLLPPLAVSNLIGEIIRDLNKQLKDSEQKTVSNEGLASQYTYPVPNIPNIPALVYEQKFEKLIILNQRKQNNVVSFRGKSTFSHVPALHFLSNLSTAETLETTLRKFIKIPKLETIKEFSILSIKDESSESDNLTSNIECGQTRTIADGKINIADPPSFLELASTTNEKVKFLYLDRINDSASGLIFKELDEPVITSIANGEKILVRMGAVDNFYDSYFYVEG